MVCGITENFTKSRLMEQTTHTLSLSRISSSSYSSKLVMILPETWPIVIRTCPMFLIADCKPLLIPNRLMVKETHHQNSVVLAYIATSSGGYEDQHLRLNAPQSPRIFVSPALLPRLRSDQLTGIFSKTHLEINAIPKRFAHLR